MDKLAAEIRLAEDAQRRVCEIHRVVMSGWPTMAMADRDGFEEAGLKDKDAVWRMCVCGTETVITIRRGGYGDEGAVAGPAVSEGWSLERRIVLCCCPQGLVLRISWVNK